MSQRPVLSLKQLTLNQWVAYPNQKPCFYCLLLCLYVPNIIGGQNANCRGGQGAAGECQLPVSMGRKGSDAADGGSSWLSSLGLWHVTQTALCVTFLACTCQFCKAPILLRESFRWFLPVLWGLGFFREAHWIIFLCKAVKIRNR